MNEFEGRALLIADRLTGVLITFVGAAVFFLSIRMPTFADRGADILTAPGIFPGAVGLMMIVAGSWLLLRSKPALDSEAGPSSKLPSGAVHRTATGFGLMLATVLLAGRIDFYLLIIGFCLAFSAAFLPWRGSSRERMRRLGAVAMTTLIAAVGIPALFEHVFLIRLP